MSLPLDVTAVDCIASVVSY